MSFLRPPTPQEAIDWSEVRTTVYPYKDFWTLNMNCVQEALTAEWMIEYNLMPDITEHILPYGGWTCVGASKECNSVFSVDFELEDKTQ